MHSSGHDNREAAASFPVNLPDYNIPEPRYLGVRVKDTVQVEVAFTTAQ
jgi:hypothetical protein